MKFFYIFLALFTTVFANSVQWQGTYDKALVLAKKQHKKLLVLIIDKKSKNVIRDFFTNNNYVDKINKNFISVVVFFEKKANYPIEMYYTTDFPTLFLVNPINETFITKPLYGIKNFDKLSIILNKG